jgi:hypothetical protein
LAAPSPDRLILANKEFFICDGVGTYQGNDVVVKALEMG